MTGLLLIAQLVVLARAPDTASVCAPIEISVAARAPGAVAPLLASFVPPAGVHLLKSTITSRVERDGRGQRPPKVAILAVLTSPIDPTQGALP